jgi:RNA polymerase sigma factor (sigma-70 family)
VSDRSQDETIRRLIRHTVRRHAGMFGAFPDIDVDDLCQEMYLEVTRALHVYDPARRLDTFVCTVVQRKMINRLRDRQRRAEWDKKYAEARPGDVVEVIDPIEEPDVVDSEGAMPLTEWLHLVFVEARRRTAPLSRERRTYTHAQSVTVKALASKLRLSTRGIHDRFVERPDFCRILGFPRIPSHRWFAYSVGADCTLLRNN